MSPSHESVGKGSNESHSNDPMTFMNAKAEDKTKNKTKSEYMI